jgi:hypothetical protein
MSRPLLINLILMCCSCFLFGQSTHLEPAAPYSPAARNITDSINQWEQATQVKVAPDARSQIADDAGGLDLSDVFIPKERYEEARVWTKDVLVKAYLYSIWARNRAQVLITKAEVQAYRLAQYVHENLAILHDPFGNIDFISNPTGATITRDSQFVGTTRMGVVVSVGSHDYAIVSDQNKLNCRRKIGVVPGKSQRMTCPSEIR